MIEAPRSDDELKSKRHTKKELVIINKARGEMDKSQQGKDLKEMIVSSTDIKISTMLGKGGFGMVHLGVYKKNRGTSNEVEIEVAVKQLLEISDENIERFRFECFLVKSLSHPNIVSLVGVVWDDFMVSCLLEYVSNGSLQDWIKKDAIKPVGDKLTWKKDLLRIMEDCALGVHFLHKSNYYDFDKNQIMECIIHRDLKPDNMLLTEDWSLKLTDFGEARAVELDLTMTQVGTPIYVAPEIMMSGR